eukprot:TRINITY_DN10129_c0_g1_i1.p1 TRINITY_DN10129_c0_g1~~TRINITY_DN10129_c0_g1_i1.p1  ORF type:complete len:763 (+),score=147.61 TRINITY_DN10129_c0_g1_i1:262-2550(+)
MMSDDKQHPLRLQIPPSINHKPHAAVPINLETQSTTSASSDSTSDGGSHGWFYSELLSPLGHLIYDFKLTILLLALFAGLTAYQSYDGREDETFEDASLRTWWLFAVVVLALWPICRLVIRVFDTWLVPRVIPNYAVQFLVHRSHRALAYTLWSILITVAWNVHFLAVNPLPGTADNDGSTRRNLMPYVLRALFLHLILAILLLCKRVIVVRLKLQRRATDYLKRVNRAVSAAVVIQLLTQSVAKRDFRRAGLPQVHEQRKKSLERRRKRMHLRTVSPALTPNSDHSGRQSASTTDGQATMGKNQAARRITETFRKVIENARLRKTESTGVTSNGMPRRIAYAMLDADDSPATSAENAFEKLYDEPEIDDLKQFLHDLENVQKQPLRACKGTVSIKSKNDAVLLGHSLFNAFCALNSDGEMHVPITNLGKIVLEDPSRFSSDVFDVIRGIFDPHDVGSLSRQWLINRCMKVYTERRHLARALSDLDSLISSLKTFLNACISIIVLILFMIIFSTGVLEELIVSVSAILLGFSFLFANAAQTLLNCFFFVFLRHPFDVSDRVVIRGDPNELLVKQISLLHTEFHHWNGKIVTYPNQVLFNSVIENMKRPTWQIGLHPFMVPISITNRQMDILEATFFDYIKAHPNEYDADLSHVQIYEVQDMERIKLVFHTIQRTSWQNAEYLWRATAVFRLIKAKIEELGIRYTALTQPVDLDERSGADRSRTRERTTSNRHELLQTHPPGFAHGEPSPAPSRFSGFFDDLT